MKLYFKNFKRTRKTSINDIFEVIFTTSYRCANTTTYYDKECINRQCKPGASRSLTDIIDIVKTYFPNATDTGILKRLYNIIDKYNKNVLKNSTDYTLRVFIFCPDVNKCVVKSSWSVDEDGIKNIIYNYIKYDDNLSDIIDKVGDGKHCMLDILLASGITAEEINEKLY